ncbi:MAG: KpsF/GutQ family sugar-phosphate isomerase [Planctomycetaceae bacterium]|nr:KpsF/GutQ family sugar-phosphate isomerase [Planctomycetaceae bacterium]
MSIEHALETIDAEIAALRVVKENLNEQFVEALDAMQACTGRVIVSGMGKAGLIGQKIAATLASTGTPSFFMHPAEALHGDLGMIMGNDVCLFLSNSGESDEITRLLPFVRRIGCRVVGITGNIRSTMAAHCEIVLHLGDIHEACPLGLAPTATTTAILAVGDALAMSLMQRRGFCESDFARVHPAGALGRRVAPVETVMRLGDAVAKVDRDTTVADTLLAMTNARAGAAVIVDATGRLEGIFCDGDLRRGLEADSDFLKRRVGDVMVRDCRRVLVGSLAGEVLDIMRENRIADIPVVDDDGMVVGLADLKGLIASL